MKNCGVNKDIFPTEDILEQHVLSSKDDPVVDDHLFLCPVCQDTLQRLDREIGELKSALRRYGPLERRGGPQLERRKELRHLADRQLTMAVCATVRFLKQHYATNRAAELA
jgi:hypothetical protein